MVTNTYLPSYCNSLKCDSWQKKVGAAQRREKFFRPVLGGVWGHAPPENFENNVFKTG